MNKGYHIVEWGHPLLWPVKDLNKLIILTLFTILQPQAVKPQSWYHSTLLMLIYRLLMLYLQVRIDAQKVERFAY